MRGLLSQLTLACTMPVKWQHRQSAKKIGEITRAPKTGRCWTFHFPVNGGAILRGGQKEGIDISQFSLWRRDAYGNANEPEEGLKRLAETAELVEKMRSAGPRPKCTDCAECYCYPRTSTRLLKAASTKRSPWRAV
jgi:hypothetical protein